MFLFYIIYVRNIKTYIIIYVIKQTANMAQNRKRPQYIEKQLKQINDILRATRMKYDDRFTNPLFSWFTDYLLQNGWYRGFNMHYDKEVTYSDGTTKVIRALGGPEYESYDYYIQIW